MAKKKKHKAKKHGPKRSKKKSRPKKKKAAKRCGNCGHTAKHGRAGCLHMTSATKFCSCKSRG